MGLSAKIFMPLLPESGDWLRLGHFGLWRTSYRAYWVRRRNTGMLRSSCACGEQRGACGTKMFSARPEAGVAPFPPLTRYTVTNAVIIGFLRFSNRYIVAACNGLKITGSAHSISICSGATVSATTLGRKIAFEGFIELASLVPANRMIAVWKPQELRADR